MPVPYPAFGLQTVKQASLGSEAQQKQPSKEKSAWGNLLALQHHRGPRGVLGQLMLQGWPTEANPPVLSLDLLTTPGCNLTLDSIVLEMPVRQSRGGGRGFPNANYHTVFIQSSTPCQGIRQSIVSPSINLYNKHLILRQCVEKLILIPPFLLFSHFGMFPYIDPPRHSSDAPRCAGGLVEIRGLGWGQGLLPSSVPQHIPADIQDSSLFLTPWVQQGSGEAAFISKWCR